MGVYLDIELSAAFRCGLIEAVKSITLLTMVNVGYPQHAAAASLKLLSQETPVYASIRLSAAFRCGLIEALIARQASLRLDWMLSAAFRCGLIEAKQHSSYSISTFSLSAAFRCGLIEAR